VKRSRAYSLKMDAEEVRKAVLVRMFFILKKMAPLLHKCLRRIEGPFKLL
jgi:hypothetical protein